MTTEEDKTNTEGTSESAGVSIQSEGDVVVSSGDIIGHDKNVNTSGGDYAEGDIDKRSGIFVDLHLREIIVAIKKILPNYIQILVGIITSPRTTFKNLVGESKSDNYRSLNANWDERPVMFAGLSLLIGIVLAKSFSLQGAPVDYSFQTMSSIVVSQIILWVVYGLGIYGAVKIFRGKGTASQTVTGTLYVLATVHVLLLVGLYVISVTLTDIFRYSPQQTQIEYKEVLINPDRGKPPNEEDIYELRPVETVVSEEKLILFRWDFRTSFFLISSLLIAFYLYFPISIIHRLSLLNTIILFIAGIGLVVVMFVLGVGVVLSIAGTLLGILSGLLDGGWLFAIPSLLVLFICWWILRKIYLRIQRTPDTIEANTNHVDN